LPAAAFDPAASLASTNKDGMVDDAELAKASGL
jgi:hypothetical protein